MGSGQSAGDVGGFRVFKVYPGSPASEVGLEVFFDYIVEIGGSQMDSDQRNFAQKIQEAENTQTKVVVYNIRRNTTREVFITPRRWAGSGLLGAVVRYDSLTNTSNQGIRVLDVFPNSPAQKAGLTPLKDYLLGTTEVMFRDMDELVEVVNLCDRKSMQISVFNSDTEAIREVTLVPDSHWGGDGSIGADIRTGLLHRIPAPRQRLAQPPPPFYSSAPLDVAAAAAPAAPGQPHGANSQPRFDSPHREDPPPVYNMMSPVPASLQSGPGPLPASPLPAQGGPSVFELSPGTVSETPA